jgi:hypothetical protein
MPPSGTASAALATNWSTHWSTSGVVCGVVALRRTAVDAIWLRPVVA